MLLSRAIAIARANEQLAAPPVICLNQIIAGKSHLVENRLDRLGKLCKRLAIVWQIMRGYLEAGHDVPPDLLCCADDDDDTIVNLPKRKWERKMGILREGLRILQLQGQDKGGN